VSGLNSRHELTYTAIVCTYNAEKTISDAIESILNQNIKPIDIVIIDDFSTDSTLECLETIAKSNICFKIIRNPRNVGQSESRNIAAKVASGEILIMFDDDDRSHASRANEHIRMHEAGADLSFVSSSKIYENGYVLDCFNIKKTNLVLDPSIWLQKLTLGRSPSFLENLWIPACTSSFRKQSFHSIGGFDPTFRRLEDAEIFIRAAIADFSCSWSQEVLVTRKATFSNLKGKGIETTHERKLIIKHKSLISDSQFKQGLLLIKVREAYFTQNYALIISLLLSNPSFALKSTFRVKRFLLRILHDIRKSSK
jgi:glycosyltransferase involved in cell wall biosynthesis